MSGPPAERADQGDLAGIGSVIGTAPVRPTTDRSPLPAAAQIAALSEATTPEAIDGVLCALREALPPDIDRLTRATIRAHVRARHPHVPSPMLDAALAPVPRSTAVPATAAGEAPRLSGAAVVLSDPSPWPAPVEGRALVEATTAAVRRYVAATDHQARAVALWIGMAYLIDVVAIAPILLVASAAMRSGKTTLCTVIGALTPRSILLSSVSAAVVYRLIESHCPTLIADEADSWLSDERSDLRGVLNAGHTRATATVARCVGDDHDVRLYSVWAARVLAMIGRPPSTVSDRAIRIELRRRTAAERIERIRADRLDTELAPLRSQWRRWADDHAEAIRRADPDVPAGLHDRAADCWRPLLAIADLIGGPWPADARRTAAELSGAATDADEGIGTELLADVRAVFDERATDRIPSADLTAALAAMVDRPWADWSRGRPLTPARLARLLRPYGAAPVTYRDGARVGRGYTRAMLLDAWARYLSLPAPETATGATSPMFAGLDRPKREVLQPGDVAPAKPAIEADDHRGCCTVAVCGAGSGGAEGREDDGYVV